MNAKEKMIRKEKIELLRKWREASALLEEIAPSRLLTEKEDSQVRGQIGRLDLIKYAIEKRWKEEEDKKPPQP